MRGANVLVRRMADGDVEAVVDLCSQLGYPSTPPQVASRFHTIAGDANQAVFVAQAANGSVIGWVHVVIRHLLAQTDFAHRWAKSISSRVPKPVAPLGT